MPRYITKVERNCEICNNKFFARGAAVRDGKGRFCSKKCSQKHRSKTANKELKCETCSKIFTIRKTVLKYGKRKGKFCSRNCMKKPLNQKILEVITGKDESKCIEWPHGKDKDGYGLARDPSKARNVRVHRAVWELNNGNIPDNMQILHRCDNPPCINIKHLFIGTNQDNITDKVLKGRQTKGSDSRSAILTEQDIIKIRKYKNGELRHSEISKIFGVSIHNIRSIIYRKSWKHIK